MPEIRHGLSENQKWAGACVVGMMAAFVIGWWGGNETGYASGWSAGQWYAAQSEERVLGRMDEIGVLDWCEKAQEIIARGNAPKEWEPK